MGNLIDIIYPNGEDIGYNGINIANNNDALYTATYRSFTGEDFDFLGFTFNGMHSYHDMKVYRVIDGDRFMDDLSPMMNDVTADNPNGEGQYFFGTRHKTKNFSINIAFDNMSDEDIRKWKKFCGGKDICDLIFDEYPHKVYSAKITGTPQLKYIPFDENGRRVYRGEGTIQFTAYWPYAHTPDENTKLSTYFAASGTFGTNGKKLSSYEALNPIINKEQLSALSGITELTGECTGENPGDLPAPFVLITDDMSETEEDTEFKVGNLSIVVKTNTYNLQWDSKSGIVSGTVNISPTSTRKPIPYTGESLGGIPVGGTTNIQLNGATLKYDYWYY